MAEEIILEGYKKYNKNYESGTSYCKLL